MSGWDLVEYWCGRCGRTVFTAETEGEYLRLLDEHQEEHDRAPVQTDGGPVDPPEAQQPAARVDESPATVDPDTDSV